MSGTEVETDVLVIEPDEPGLSTHVLSEAQVLAESIGMIGPSLSAAAIVPLAFATAGGASWLTVVIATLAMVAVAAMISALARRHVSMGALYTLIPKGLGPAGGLLAGGGFVLIALAGQMISILGFGAALAQFLESAFSIGHGVRAELVIFDLGGLALATLVTLRGINLSTKILFVLEIGAMIAISALLVVILFKHGHIFDSDQLQLKGSSVHGILLGTTFLVLAFGGFESATALGVEAREPRRAIPIALFGSVIFVGIFFVLNAYIQILGFQGSGLEVAEQAVPLGALADHYGVGWLGNIVLFGVVMSWFGVLCAWLNYAPRPIVAMSEERVLPGWLSRTDPKTGSPIAASLMWVGTWLVITLFLVISNSNLTQAYGNIAYLAGYGYTFLYLLMAAAALVYAFREGFRKAWFILSAVFAGAVMILVYWYSFNPLPEHPVDIYVYGFAAFVAALLVGCLVARALAPQWLGRMGRVEVSDAE